MSDPISRQAAINAVKEWFNEWFIAYEINRTTSNVTSIQDRLRQLPSAQRWIPCSERLPEENGRYLATRGLNACGDLWNRVYIVNYSDLMGTKSEKIWWSGNFGKSDFEKYEDVLAWMPLPEPYGSEE